MIRPAITLLLLCCWLAIQAAAVEYQTLHLNQEVQELMAKETNSVHYGGTNNQHVLGKDQALPKCL